MPRYAYSASEGAICHGAMYRGELKAGRLRNRLAIPRGSPYGRTRLSAWLKAGGKYRRRCCLFRCLATSFGSGSPRGSGEASSGQITGRCKLSQLIPMIFTACMERLQSLSNFVILQCILNPVILGCLLALGPKGISCRRRGLGGNHSLLLIRHVFAHCRVVGGKNALSQRS
jgi:hypothetical protein